MRLKQATLNRTKVELKRKNAELAKAGENALNRTKVELKQIKLPFSFYENSSQSYQSGIETQISRQLVYMRLLSIVPKWN